MVGSNILGFRSFVVFFFFLRNYTIVREYCYLILRIILPHIPVDLPLNVWTPQEGVVVKWSGVSRGDTPKLLNNYSSFISFHLFLFFIKKKKKLWRGWIGRLRVCGFYACTNTRKLWLNIWAPACPPACVKSIYPISDFIKRKKWSIMSLSGY